MRRKNILIIILIIIGITALIAVESFIRPQMKQKQQKYTEAQLDPATNDYKTIIKYKNKYMGNASNICNLNRNLPLADIPMTFEIKPDKLTLVINYETSSETIDKNKLLNALLYNSTAIFMLIDNLKVIKFNFKDNAYIVTREAVESWYGVKLNTLQNEKTWKDKVQSRLKTKGYADIFFTQKTLIER